MESNTSPKNNTSVQATTKARKREVKAKSKDTKKKFDKAVLSASSTQPDSQVIKIGLEPRGVASLVKTQYVTLYSVLNKHPLGAYLNFSADLENTFTLADLGKMIESGKMQMRSLKEDVATLLQRCVQSAELANLGIYNACRDIIQ